MIHVIPSQMSGLSLTPIDGKEVGELTELTPESLTDIDKEGVQYEITVLEEKLAQMKPNMAAIAEYRKKVGEVLTKAECVTLLNSILLVKFKHQFGKVI